MDGGYLDLTVTVSGVRTQEQTAPFNTVSDIFLDVVFHQMELTLKIPNVNDGIIANVKTKAASGKHTWNTLVRLTKYRTQKTMAGKRVARKLGLVLKMIKLCATSTK